MADVSKRLGKGSVSSGGDVVVYTAPVGKRVFLKAATFCNKYSADAAFSVKLADVNLISNHKIKAYDTLTIPFLDQVFEGGEKLVISLDGFMTMDYYFSGREVDV